MKFLHFYFKNKKYLFYALSVGFFCKKICLGCLFANPIEEKPIVKILEEKNLAPYAHLDLGESTIEAIYTKPSLDLNLKILKLDELILDEILNDSELKK